MITVRCLACVVASLTASALGVTIDYTTIGNPGNAPNTNGWGSVSAHYRLATYETANAQYVEFLNRIDSSGTNPNGIYSAQMGGDALGGITFNSGASSGSKYSVKAGTNPNNVPYGNAPVVFATWFSAARFVNWLSNGQSASTASMENGTYALNNQTSGAIPPRNQGSGVQIALPSRDEWYKAAYYEPVSAHYLTLRGTNTITQTTLMYAANFGGTATPTFGPIAVGSYAFSTTPYGLHDMLGNVIEFTETPGTIDFDTGRPQVFSGSWATPVAEIGLWNVNSLPIFRGATTSTGEIGFRVAEVQAVPEPAGLLLGGVGAAVAVVVARRVRRGITSLPLLARRVFSATFRCVHEGSLASH
jgi:formylglycine-generating enzyme required for sulfatase activity